MSPHRLEAFSLRLNTKSTLISVGLASLLALSACSSEGDTTTTPTQDETPVATEDAPEETEEPAETEEPVETEEPTEEPAGNFDASAVDFGDFTEITAPGTPLTKGEPAWLTDSVVFGGDEEETEFTVGVSVLEVRELDVSLFDQFSNADEFANYTPYAIIVQHTWVEDAPGDNNQQTIDLFPVKEDGSEAEYLTSGFSFSSPGDSCELELPDYDPATRTLVSCFVGLTEDLPIVTAEYNGEGYYSVIVSSDNEYWDAPLSWS